MNEPWEISTVRAFLVVLALLGATSSAMAPVLGNTGREKQLAPSKKVPPVFCMSGFHKAAVLRLRKKYTLFLSHVPFWGRVVLMRVSMGGVAVAIQINVVVATVVADRFTDGGSNGKQRFEIDGHR